MAIVRWNPARELAGMEVDRLNRMFADFYGEAFSQGWAPAVDIYETDQHEVVLKIELPEMKREDISITFENGVLTVKGERRLDETVKRENYHRVERHHGTFSRSFTLPNTVDAGRINASYREGLLTVRLPQREEAKPKQITVNAD
jgi:HSP20 family protein